MYSAWGPGMGHRKAEEGENVAVQVLTKCGRVLGVVHGKER